MSMATPLIVTKQWVLSRHDLWSRATVSQLFKALGAGSLGADVFDRWLHERIALSRVLVRSCEHVQRALRVVNAGIPALQAARDNAAYVERFSQDRGIALDDDAVLGNEGRRLVELIRVTAEEGAAAFSASMADAGELKFSWEEPGDFARAVSGVVKEKGKSSGLTLMCCALTAVWGVMYANNQGFQSTKRKVLDTNASYPESYRNLLLFLGRDNSLLKILETQCLLEEFLRGAGPGGVAKSEKTFEDVVSRVVSALEQVQQDSATSGRAPLCRKCGRKGHVDQRCTFKSHV